MNNRRIEAEIHISADSWSDLQDMIDAIDREVLDAQAADENFSWTNATKNASAEVSIKRADKREEHGAAE